MGSLKRKLARKKKLKKVKKAKKDLKSALNATMGIPTDCSDCGKSFDPVKDADTWMVAVFDKVVSLKCPECYEKALTNE